MHLWLTPAQAAQIVRHAQDAAPHEACGLIGGRDGQALAVIPVENVAAQPNTQYRLDPAQQAQAMLQFHREGLDLLAIYHSHPTSDTLPSPVDVREATYPDALYLIAGLRTHPPQLAAWQLGHDATPADLYVQHARPEVSQEPTLTPAQRTIIILATAAIFVAVILLSLYLLPPAPPIPTPSG